MARLRFGITLTEDTLKRLEFLCDAMGMAKSQSISLAVNTYYFENKERLIAMKGESPENE